MVLLLAAVRIEMAPDATKCGMEDTNLELVMVLALALVFANDESELLLDFALCGAHFAAAVRSLHAPAGKPDLVMSKTRDCGRQCARSEQE